MVAYPKQVFTFTVSVVHENSAQAYSHVFAASLNACIALLNQTGIAQREAPCAAMTVGYNSQSKTFRTDDHSDCDSFIDLVVSLASNDLNFVILTTKGASGNAIFSPRFEQVVRQTANQITQTTFTQNL